MDVYFFCIFIAVRKYHGQEFIILSFVHLIADQNKLLETCKLGNSNDLEI